MKATDILRNEHEVIQQVLDCVEELAVRAERDGAVDISSARAALDFLGMFADRCHHGKEEQQLFPMLNAKGLPTHVGPIAVMLHEHELGRAAIVAMRNAVDDCSRSVTDAPTRFVLAARGYVELLRDHIEKENGVLFPMADQMLDEQAQQALLRGFDSIEHEDLGVETHERYLKLAWSLCERLDVEWIQHPVAAHSCCGQHGACH